MSEQTIVKPVETTPLEDPQECPTGPETWIAGEQASAHLQDGVLRVYAGSNPPLDAEPLLVLRILPADVTSIGVPCVPGSRLGKT